MCRYFFPKFFVFHGKFLDYSKAFLVGSRAVLFVERDVMLTNVVKSAPPALSVPATLLLVAPVVPIVVLVPAHAGPAPRDSMSDSGDSQVSDDDNSTKMSKYLTRRPRGYDYDDFPVVSSRVQGKAPVSAISKDRCTTEKIRSANPKFWKFASLSAAE